MTYLRGVAAGIRSDEMLHELVRLDDVLTEHADRTELLRETLKADALPEDLHKRITEALT